MNIIAGRTYTNSRSDLAIKVLSVRDRGSEYIKVKGVLFEKITGYIIETKNYKLMFKLISDWIEYEEDKSD